MSRFVGPVSDCPGPPVAGSIELGGVIAATAQSDDHHRTKRNRRLHFAVITALVTRPLSLIIPFVSLPLFIRYLGPEGYGLYESVGALAVWLAATNAGLSLGLQNRLQDCYVSGDRALARRYVSSLTMALGAISVVGVVLLSVVTPLVDWHAVFPTKDIRPAGETAWAFWAAGIITLLGVAVSIPYSAYTAYQEIHAANLWEGAAKLATLGACVTVVWTRFGLVGVILAASGTTLFMRIVNAVWFFAREKPWLRPTPRLFEWALLRVTLAEGVYLFVLQIATGLIFHVDKLIIGNRLGAAEVTDYAVLGRLFLIAYALSTIVQGALWPAYGEAIRRGDFAWARRTIGRMLTLTTCGAVAWGAVLYFAGGPIFRFVTHGEPVYPPKGLIVAVTAFFVVRAWAECQSVPLNAAGVVKPQLAILLANGVLNALLAIILVRPFGVLGVAWAFPITAAVTSLWGYPMLIRRHIRAPRPAEAT